MPKINIFKNCFTLEFLNKYIQYDYRNQKELTIRKYNIYFTCFILLLSLVNTICQTIYFYKFSKNRVYLQNLITCSVMLTVSKINM